ncbi:MAG: hypothetical protein WHV28_09615 [Bacteroidota bacterium]
MLVTVYEAKAMNEQYIKLWVMPEKLVSPEKFQDFFGIYRGIYTNSFRVYGARGFLMMNTTYISKPKRKTKIKIGLHLYIQNKEPKFNIIEKTQRR